MPKQQPESNKVMNEQTGKSSGKTLGARAAVSPSPMRYGGSSSRRLVARGGKPDAQATLGGASLLASKVTARFQTTLPSGVRKALGLQAGDQIVYEIEKDQVIIRRANKEEDDPALDGFLDLLGDDIANHKDRIVLATAGFANYLEELTAGIEVDYDAPIEGDFRL